MEFNSSFNKSRVQNSTVISYRIYDRNLPQEEGRSALGRWLDFKLTTGLQDVGSGSHITLQSGARGQIPSPNSMRVVGIRKPIISLRMTVCQVRRIFEIPTNNLGGPSGVGVVLRLGIDGGGRVKNIDTPLKKMNRGVKVTKEHKHLSWRNESACQGFWTRCWRFDTRNRNPWGTWCCPERNKIKPNCP